MIRGYDEFLARIFDHVDPAWVVLALLAVAVATGVLWYTYPAWLRLHRPRIRRPRIRWPRIRWPRPKWRLPRWKWKWKWRRPRFQRKPKPEPVEPKPPAPVPDPEPEPEPQPMATAMSPADRLAAEGRYAEAIRERLRESVAALTRYGVIAPAPAWTAHEVAAQASANRPAVSAPLTGATEIFAQIWYGHRPAGADQDAQMRRLTAEIKAALETYR